MKKEAKKNFKPLLVIGVGTLALVITGYQIYTGSKGSRFSLTDDIAKQRNAISSAPATAKETENLDSDGDSIPDTIEVNTYHTNPLSADTDHDGYKDNEEIASGYDPLTPSEDTPNYGISSVYSKKSSTSATTTDNVSGFKSIDDYAADKKINEVLSKNSTDTSDLSSLANVMAANSAIYNQQNAPTVNDNEILVDSGSGKGAVEKYMMAVSSAVIKNSPFNDLNSATKYVQAATLGDATKINQMVASSQKLEKALLSVPVPAELKEKHKQAIGTLRLFRQSAPMVALDSDSLSSDQGFAAINQVQSVMTSVEELMNSGFDLLSKYNIKINLHQ